MGLGSCYTCIKYLMFAFNFLFSLLGMAIFAIGIWVRVDPNFIEYMDHNLTYEAAYLIIVVGCVIVVIGFFGCCGAKRKSQCLLGLFFVSLFVIFAVLLGTGIYCVVEKDSIMRLVANNTTDHKETNVNSYLIHMAGCAFGIALIMILGMILSMVLRCAIRDVNA